VEKRFCDICEAPAEAYDHKVEIKKPIGDHYQAYKSDSAGGVQGVWQCKIVLRPVVTFEEHPRGFGGPPDLCRECLTGLLNDLRASLETGPGMATFRQEAAK